MKQNIRTNLLLLCWQSGKEIFNGFFYLLVAVHLRL